MPVWPCAEPHLRRASEWRTAAFFAPVVKYNLGLPLAFRRQINAWNPGGIVAAQNRAFFAFGQWQKSLVHFVAESDGRLQCLIHTTQFLGDEISIHPIATPIDGDAPTDSHTRSSVGADAIELGLLARVWGLWNLSCRTFDYGRIPGIESAIFKFQLRYQSVKNNN